MRLACDRSSNLSSDQIATASFTPKHGQHNNSTRGKGCRITIEHLHGNSCYHGQNGGRGNSCYAESGGSNKSNNTASSINNRVPPRESCQICKRNGHSALDCYHRMDFVYQGRHPPARLAAMATSNQFPGVFFHLNHYFHHLLLPRKAMTQCSSYEKTQCGLLCCPIVPCIHKNLM